MRFGNSTGILQYQIHLWEKKFQDLNKIYFVVSDEAVFSVNEFFFDRKRSWENQIYNSYHMNMVILPS